MGRPAGAAGGHRSLYGPGVPEQRHSDPDRTAYHVQPPQEPQVCPKQKCAGYRRQRLRQDPLLVEAEPDADAQFLCGHGPERHHPGGVRQDAPARRAQAGQGRQAGEGQERQGHLRAVPDQGAEHHQLQEVHAL